MPATEYNQARTVRLKAAGLCTNCGTKPSESGRSKCKKCRDAIRRGAAAWRARKVADGLCSHCGKAPPAAEQAYCESCRSKNTRRNRDNYHNGAADRAKERTKQLRLLVFNAYGGAFCACCGEGEYVFLTLDHVNNDGAEHRRQVGATQVYRWIRDNGFPPGFQVLCWNCNLAKKIAGECPHRK